MKFADVFRRAFPRWGGRSGIGRLLGGTFPLRNLSRGKRISMKGVQDFLALLKKKQ